MASYKPIDLGFQPENLNLKSPIAAIGSTPMDSRSFLDPVKSSINTDVMDGFKLGGVGKAPDGGFDMSNFLFGSGAEGDKGFLIPGLQTLSGLTGAYTGYKALGLAEDQFDFAKGQSNRDFQNQAKVYNTNLEAQQRALLSGQTERYDTSTPEGRAQFEADLAAYVKQNTIDPNQVL